MPKVNSEGAPSSILGCAVGGIIVAVLLLAILYPFRQAPAQSVDVWSRAAWMFANAKNEQVFPPKAELCAAPFCRRVDTEPKYVGGNPGHRSETKLPFCPEHTSGLPSTGSRFDDLLRFIYWVLAMALSWLEVAVVLGLASYPFALAVAFFRPDKAAGPWRRAVDYSLTFGVGIGGVASLLVWGMFAWW